MFVWSCLSPLSFLLLIHTYFHIHILRTYIHSYMTNCTLKLSSSYISMMSLHAVMMIKALLSCCPATHTYMELCHLEALFTCITFPSSPNYFLHVHYIMYTLLLTNYMYVMGMLIHILSFQTIRSLNNCTKWLVSHRKYPQHAEDHMLTLTCAVICTLRNGSS